MYNNILKLIYNNISKLISKLVKIFKYFFLKMKILWKSYKTDLLEFF